MTFLLIATASFALFSRVTDYVVTSREMNKAMSHYTAVAALNNGVPDTSYAFQISKMPATFDGYFPMYGDKIPPPTYLSAEHIEAFSALSGITSAETRYMTGGVIREYERFYRWEGLDWGFNYPARFIVEGTFSSFDIDNIAPSGHSSFDVYHLFFEDSKVLGGNYPLEELSDDIFRVQTMPNTWQHTTINFTPELEWRYYPWRLYDLEFIESLEIGGRYVLIGRYSTLVPELDTDLGDFDTNEYFPSVTKLYEQPENYLKLPEFYRLQELIEITNKDLHTFDIVYTSEMRSIPRVNEQSMQIYEGRFLTPEDTENNTRVCVVSYPFFIKNNLSIGDKLTIELGDRLFPQHAGIGAITYVPERAWNTVKTIEVEIVGVYIDADSPHERVAEQYWGYHPCTIFVPMSLLPIEVPASHKVYAGEFSVFIENPANINMFLEAARPLISDWLAEATWDYYFIGDKWGDRGGFLSEPQNRTGSKLYRIEMRFSDNGWALVKDSINASGTTSLITTASFNMAAVLALLLATYLYIGRNKKTYAIIRALGVPKLKAGNSLTLPLIVLSALAIPIGGIAGLIYTSRTVTPMLDELSATVERYTVNASLPVGVIILCLLGILGLISLFTILFLQKMGKTPPLELLQGDVIKINTAYNIPISLQNELAPIISFSPIPKKDLPERGKYSAFHQVSVYILRHISRVKWKTAISLTLAVALTGAVGFLALTRLFYKDLFHEIIVHCSATNFSTSAITELLDSELTENLYYHSDYVVLFDETELAYLTLTNDFERFMSSFFWGEYTIEYTSGFNDTLFFTEDNLMLEDNALCIIGRDFFIKYGVKPGDIIKILGTDDDYTIESEAVYYKVAAIVDTNEPMNNINDRIYTPLGANIIRANNNKHFSIEYAEFLLTDNEKTVELLILLDELREDSRQYSIAAEYVADTIELDNIRRVRDLLIMLFPIALAGVVLIGLTAPGLIIIQSAKEAAILRVLGVTKKRARCMLMFEQIGLCVVGIALAAGGLVLYNSVLFTRSAETLAVCGVLYLLGCVCAAFGASVSVTRRKIIELLQVKE
jgi:hypothetical protein